MKITLQLENTADEYSFHYMIRRAFHLAKCEDAWNMAELKDDHEGLLYKTCCGNIFEVDVTTENNNPRSSLFSFQGSRESFRKLKPFEETLEWASQGKDKDGEFLVLKGKYQGREILFKLRVAFYETSTPREWNLGPLDVVEKINDSEAQIKRFNNFELVPYENKYQTS